MLVSVEYTPILFSNSSEVKTRRYRRIIPLRYCKSGGSQVKEIAVALNTADSNEIGGPDGAVNINYV